MGQFAYDFSLMLLHSLWQSALLLLVYKISMFFINGQLPFYRRNVLFFILLIQLCISAATFAIYANNVQSLQPAILEISTLVSEGSLLRDLVPLVFAIYVLIIAYKTSLLFYHWDRFKTKCNSSLAKASIGHRSFAINKASDMGIGKKITLWYSDVITSPITFGYLKPVILLPVALLNQLSVKEAEMLILHELTHIKNNDYLLNFLLIVCETLFFFNPFITKICGLVKLEREKNCDVEVVQSTYSPLVYAETLLKIARFKSEVNRLHLAAASDNKQLLNRVIFFTSENNLRFTKNKYASFTYLFLALIFVLNLVTIKEFNRKPGKSGYEFVASTMPGYNAYSLTNSFNDADNVALPDKLQESKNEVVVQNKKKYTNDKIYYKGKQNKSVIHPIEAEEVFESEENQFMPVANVGAEVSKEFIFNEENSAGNKVTKAYKMILVNGKWVVQPLWMYTESRIRRDSLNQSLDSLPRAFHIIQ